MKVKELILRLQKIAGHYPEAIIKIHNGSCEKGDYYGPVDKDGVVDKERIKYFNQGEEIPSNEDEIWVIVDNSQLSYKI